MENMRRKFTDEYYVKLRILNFVRLIIFMNTNNEVTFYCILSMYVCISASLNVSLVNAYEIRGLHSAEDSVYDILDYNTVGCDMSIPAVQAHLLLPSSE